jgi:NhaP-type Na+/H+ or K+/H+ antiporter
LRTKKTTILKYTKNKCNIVQIWILSFPMVLVGTAITGVVAKYCLPYQSENPLQYGWASWFTLGAILASTDPIAVSSVLKTAGASPRLVMHISGESLLNDGSSYVFFTIAANKWYSYLKIPPAIAYTTVWEWIGYFFQMSLGGSLMGMVFGFGLLGVLWELDRRMEKDFDIVQVVMGLTAAYLCYYVCDQMLTMSGVVATVALGVVVNRFGRGMINDEGLMSSYLALVRISIGVKTKMRRNTAVTKYLKKFLNHTYSLSISLFVLTV